MVKELAAVRQLLEALRSGAMSVRENGNNVTKREIDKLAPDIKYLETALARSNKGGAQ